VRFAHAIEDKLGGLAEFHFGGMEQRQLPLGIEARFGRDQLEDCKRVQRPAMPSSDQPQLRFAFGKRDIETLFASAGPFEQILERERRLAGSRLSFHEIQPVTIEATVKDVIEADDSRGDSFGSGQGTLIAGDDSGHELTGVVDEPTVLNGDFAKIAINTGCRVAD